MKKKAIIVLLLFVGLFFLKSEKELALNYTINYTEGSTNKSGGCGGDLCVGTLYNYQNTNIPIYGARFTLFKNGQKPAYATLKNYKYVDIVRDSEGKNVFNGNNSGIFIEDKENTYVTVGSGCKDNQSVPYCYAEWLNYLNKEENKGEGKAGTNIVNNIIQRFRTKYKNSMPSNDDLNDYYLLVEPILKIYIKGSLVKDHTITGTPSEIVDYLNDYPITNKWTKGVISDFTKKNSSNSISGECKPYNGKYNLVGGPWAVLNNNYTYLKLKKTYGNFERTVEDYKYTEATACANFYRAHWSKTVYGKALIKLSSFLIPPPDSKINIKIVKKDENKKGLNGAIFSVKTGCKSNCGDCKNTIGSCTTEGEGVCTITNVNDGNYCIVEDKAPNGYSKGKGYIFYEKNKHKSGYSTSTISNRKTVTVNFVNSKTGTNCQKELDTKVLSIWDDLNFDARVRLLKNIYYDYPDPKTKERYQDLLDFDNPSCSNTKQIKTTHNFDVDCLNASYTLNNKNDLSEDDIDNSSSLDNDFSNFDEAIDINGTYKAFCKVEFDFSSTGQYDSKIANEGDIYFNVKNLDGTVMSGEFTKRCFVSENADKELIESSLKSKGIQPEEIKSYMQRNKNSSKINLVTSVSVEDKNVKKINNHIYEYRVNVNFNIPKVCVSKSGEKLKSCNAKNQSNIIEKYGIFAPYGEDKSSKKTLIEDNYTFGLEINFNNETTKTATCNYNYKINSSYKDEIEFRVIDLKNPFVDKNGNKRNTMTNWCYNTEKIQTSSIKESPKEKDNYEYYLEYNIMDVLPIQNYMHGTKSLKEIVESGGNNVKKFEDLDIYSDNSINALDEYYLRLLIGEFDNITMNSCTSDNILVQSIIWKGHDKYSKTTIAEAEKEPKYKILLTPKVMEDIKKESKNYKYNLDNLTCDDNNICISSLLTYLSSDNMGLKITNSAKRKNFGK